MNIQEKWEQARPNITEAVSSEVVYNTYLKDAVALSYKNNVLTLSVSLPTKKRMIELKYKTIIEKEMAKINFWSNNGDAYTLNAIISHDTVFIDQSYRDIYVDEAKSLFSIAVNGEGRLLSNGDINILLYYNGRAHNAEYVLTGSQIQLLAKKQ